MAFNKYYKRATTNMASGRSPEDVLQAATEDFLFETGYPFAFPHCVLILHKMRKFQAHEDGDMDQKNLQQ